MFCSRLILKIFLAISVLVWTSAVSAQEAPAPEGQDTAPVATDATESRSSSVPAPDELGVENEVLDILLVPLTAADLSALAAVWQGHLQGSLQTATAIYLGLLDAEEGAAEALREQVTSTTYSPLSEINISICRDY